MMNFGKLKVGDNYTNDFMISAFSAVVMAVLNGVMALLILLGKYPNLQLKDILPWTSIIPIGLFLMLLSIQFAINIYNKLRWDQDED